MIRLRLIGYLESSMSIAPPPATTESFCIARLKKTDLKRLNLKAIRWLLTWRSWWRHGGISRSPPWTARRRRGGWLCRIETWDILGKGWTWERDMSKLWKLNKAKSALVVDWWLCLPFSTYLPLLKSLASSQGLVIQVVHSWLNRTTTGFHSPEMG